MAGPVGTRGDHGTGAGIAFMPLKTMLINGPTGGGKSTVARLIVREVLGRPIHMVRLQTAHDGHTNAVEQLDVCGPNADWASEHRVTYTPDRIFEIIQEGLRAVRRLEPAGFAVVEADADPAVRHAYPYDYRVFVMPAPADVHQVFREPQDAMVALQQVMQDTAAFASEIFGLFDADGLDDSAGVHHSQTTLPRLVPGMADRFERLDIGEPQLRRFTCSPLGAEIASRIQLQPEYHAIVEADVVLIRTEPGDVGPALRECIRRVEKLLSRIRHDARQHSVLYWGELDRPKDPARPKLIRRLRELLERKTLG